MGKLQIKPDADDDGPKLSDMVSVGEIKDRKKEDKEKGNDGTMMVCCFKIDAKYPRTIPGFFRLIQVLFLVVGTVCLLFAEWTNAGIFAVFCLILVAAAVCGGYLLLTKLTGSRSNNFCGFNWVFLVSLLVIGCFS